MSAQDKNEILALAGILKEFNETAKETFIADPVARVRLQIAGSREDKEKLEELADQALESLIIVINTQGAEDAKIDYILKTIAYVDQLLLMAREAGLEEKFAQSFPARHKNEKNAQAFRRAGGPQIAQLCHS